MAGDAPAHNGYAYYSNGYHVATAANAPPNAAVTLTPISLSASGSAVNGSYMDAYVSVQTYPITITLAGAALVNGAFEALTGQQISASLSGLSALPNFPSGYTVSYQWSTTGATSPNPFKNWDYNAPGDGTATQLVPLGPTDLNQSSFSFYDEKGNDAVTVNCTATVTFPNSATGTITAQSQPITFVKPTASCVAKQGYPQEYTSDDPKYAGYVFFGMVAVPGSVGYADGESWQNITISVPSAFTGTGTACFAQLYTPHRYAVEGTNHVPGQGYVNGQEGLDGSFLYDNVTWSVPGTPPSPPEGDSPADGLLASTNIVSNTGTAESSQVINDSARTWLMYKPPAYDNQHESVYVPLLEYGWSWSETVTWESNATPPAWSLTAQSPATTTTPTTLTPGVIDTYPTWTIIQNL